MRELFKITLHLTFSRFPAIPENLINNHSFVHILLSLSLSVLPSLPLHMRYKNLSIPVCYSSNCAIKKFTIKKFKMTYAKFNLGLVVKLEACYFMQTSTRRLSKGENVTPVQKQTLRRVSDARCVVIVTLQYGNVILRSHMVSCRECNCRSRAITRLLRTTFPCPQHLRVTLSRTVASR